MAPDIREVVFDLLHAVLKRAEIEAKFVDMCLDILRSAGINVEEEATPEDLARVQTVTQEFMNGKVKTLQLDGVDRLHLILYAGKGGYVAIITSDPWRDHLKVSKAVPKMDLCENCPDRDTCDQCEDEETSDGKTIH